MKIGAVVLFALLLMVAPVGATTITFESLTPGYGPDAVTLSIPKGTDVTVGAPLATSGVLFSTSVAGPGVGAAYAYVSSEAFVQNGGGAYGTNYLVVHTWPQGLPPGTLTINFVSPSNSSLAGTVVGTGLSLYVKDTESTVRFDLYGLSNNLLETWNLTTVNPLPDPPRIHTFTTAGDVNKIVVTDLGGDGFTLDEITFGEITAVPEPGTLALLGAGLVALGLISRRRRSR